MTCRVLVACSSFPPVHATAIHRTVAVCRRLAADGHEVTVLTPIPRAGMSIDEALLARVPASVRVIRTPEWDPIGAIRAIRPRRQEGRPEAEADAPGEGGRSGATGSGSAAGRIVDWCSWWLHVPDPRIGWLLPALQAGIRHGRRVRPHVVYSSAPMWTTHLVGMALSKVLGVPWVADCRDPWRANPFRRFPFRSHDRLDAYLERRMVTAACRVLCNAEPVRADFARRYPRHAGKFLAVHNGYDEAVVGDVRRAGPRPRSGVCRFIHAGVFYGPRSPVPFLRGMAELASGQPARRQTVRFEQVGPADFDGRRIGEIAEKLGVADMVDLTAPLPHRQALERVFDADVAVAAGQMGEGCDLQIPRKFYEYYGLGKPILVTGGTAKAVGALLADADPDGVWLVDNADGNADDLAAAMSDIVGRWERGRLFRTREPAADFTERRMAGQIEAVLLAACRAGKKVQP